MNSILNYVQQSGDESLFCMVPVLWDTIYRYSTTISKNAIPFVKNYKSIENHKIVQNHNQVQRESLIFNKGTTSSLYETNSVSHILLHIYGCCG
jgi:hypothetical protein